jgi:hypothetical protein
MDVPLYREMHRIMLEVIRYQEQGQGAHAHELQRPATSTRPEGSFGNRELYIPGLTPLRR